MGLREEFATTDMTSTGAWIGRQMVDTAGAKIGTVQHVFFDDAAGRPEWLVVKTGLFGSKESGRPCGRPADEW
jgi:hypothetical protein